MVLFRHGIGMCMTTACMHTYSLPRPIRCGGTGVGTGVWPVLVSDGDGIRPGIITVGILLGTAVGILHIGMADSMLVTGEAIGDSAGIILIPDGEEVGFQEDIPISVRPVMKTMQAPVVREVLQVEL